MKKNTRDYPKFAEGGAVRDDKNPILKPGVNYGWMQTPPAQTYVNVLDRLKNEPRDHERGYDSEKQKQVARDAAIEVGQTYEKLPKNLENYPGMAKGGPIKRKRK